MVSIEGLDGWQTLKEKTEFLMNSILFKTLGLIGNLVGWSQLLQNFRGENEIF